MSNDFYNNSTHTLATGTTAKATDVEGKCDEIVTGFDKLPDENELVYGLTFYAADSGAANAYVVALPHTATSYLTGMSVVMKVGASNTGASTINVDGLGAKAIKTQSGNDVGAGDLVADQIVELRYNGTAFNLMKGGAANSTDFCQVANNLSDVVAATARANLGVGAQTISTSAASGGVDNDIWFQVS